MSSAVGSLAGEGLGPSFEGGPWSPGDPARSLPGCGGTKVPMATAAASLPPSSALTFNLNEAVAAEGEVCKAPVWVAEARLARARSPASLGSGARTRQGTWRPGAVLKGEVTGGR